MDTGSERRRRSQNWILRALPPDDFTRLSPHLASVRLTKGDVLADDTVGGGRVYFMMSGACSAMLTTRSGDTIEVASISCEGLTSGVHSGVLGLGVQLIVTVEPAIAIRLGISEFTSEMDRGGALRAVVSAYYRSFHEEVMLMVACNRLHSARARCCRRLLTLADRIGSDRLHLTHAVLASMLGVTRPSVTLIAGYLRRTGVIDYARDEIVLLDRGRLERAACECYHFLRRPDHGGAFRK